MTVKFEESDGTDLDAVFELKQAGDPAAATTGYQDLNGNDLATRYAPVSVGDKVAANTGLQKSDGSDLRLVFCGKGLRLVVTMGAEYGACTSPDSVTPCSVTRTMTAVASGGKAPYTYAFAVTSGPASLINKSGNTVDATHSGLNATHTSTIRVTVTDANGVQISGNATFKCTHTA